MSRRGPHVYRRGNVWWCWFRTAGGARVYRTTGQRVRALAVQAARALERDHLAALTATASPPLDEVIAAWLTDVERRGRSPETLGFYLKTVRPLVRELGSRAVDTLTLADLEAYVDQRLAGGVAGRATVAKELGCVRAALRYARRRGLYRGEVAAVLPELGQVYHPRERTLTREEFRSLLDALAPARRDYLIVWVGTGVRDGELYELRAGDVDLDGDLVHVRGTKTSRADRWIPMLPAVREVLARRASGIPTESLTDSLFGPWRNQRRDVREACDRAGIAPASPNDFRRTFATWLAEAGVPELVTASLLGHASSQMVRRVYTRVRPSTQQAAIRALAAVTAVTNGVTRGSLEALIDARGALGAEHPPASSSTEAVPRAGIEPATRGFSGGPAASSPAKHSPPRAAAAFLKIVRGL